MERTNKVELIGYTGMNPELKELENGSKVASFTLATRDSYKNKEGEWVNNTTWHRVIAWNKVAEKVMETISKGAKIIVDGKIDYKQWDDKNGNKRTTAEIVLYGFKPAETK
jgi:single-strand DNA-binding protein